MMPTVVLLPERSHELRVGGVRCTSYLRPIFKQFRRLEPDAAARKQVVSERFQSASYGREQGARLDFGPPRPS